MVSILPERINKTAPYKVERGKDERTVKFTTDFNVTYVVGFEYTDILLCAETYEFAITNFNHKKSPRDSKLRDTIMAIVLDFFLSCNTAMLYICETGDNKQSMRNRLFSYWAATNPQFKFFSLWTASVVDEDGTYNYATLVLRNDHPRRREVIEEFTTTVDMLNDKPSSNE